MQIFFFSPRFSFPRFVRRHPGRCSTACRGSLAALVAGASRSRKGTAGAAASGGNPGKKKAEVRQGSPAGVV